MGHKMMYSLALRLEVLMFAFVGEEVSSRQYSALVTLNSK